MNQTILTKKGYFQNFSWFQFYVYNVLMHDYVHWHCSIEYCFKLILVDKTLCENCFYFTLKWFLCNLFGEMCFLEENYKVMQKIIKFWNFWACPLYEIWECAFNGMNMAVIFSINSEKWYLNFEIRYDYIVWSLTFDSKYLNFFSYDLKDSHVSYS